MKAEKTTYNDKYYISKFRGRTTEDQLLKHATELKEKRSITPDTHKSRTLVKNIEELAKFGLIKELKIVEKQVAKENLMLQKENTDNQFYVDEYQYKDSKTSHVVRFGIDKYNEELKKELSIHNDKLKENLKKALEEKIETKSDISNISGVTKYKPFCEKYIELTSYEKTVIENAISYMFHADKKTCMVDVLPREFNEKNTGVGTVNIKNLDVHTVVLYNAGDKVLVIDPNNPMFSSHLNKFKGLEILCDTNPQYKLYSRPEESNTGYNPKLYRDCVDVAVKIAFVLNNSGNTYRNLNEIMDSEMIKLITNNSLIDKTTFKISELVRNKQSSDFGKIIETNKKMEKFSALEEFQKDSSLKTFSKKMELLQTEYNDELSAIAKEHETFVLKLSGEYEYIGGDNYEI